MKGMKALLTAVVLTAVLAMAGPAAAQFYIGATIGQAEFKEGCLGTGECGDEDTAWRILGGYHHGSHLRHRRTLGLHEEVRRARRMAALRKLGRRQP